MTFKIGYAQAVITPSLARPVYLAGFGRNRRPLPGPRGRAGRHDVARRSGPLLCGSSSDGRDAGAGGAGGS